MPHTNIGHTWHTLAGLRCSGSHSSVGSCRLRIFLHTPRATFIDSLFLFPLSSSSSSPPRLHPSPYTFKVLHNLFLMLWSLGMLIGLSFAGWQQLSKYGWQSLFCGTCAICTIPIPTPQAISLLWYVRNLYNPYPNSTYTHHD